MKCWVVLFFAFLTDVGLRAQSECLKVVSWNVENLFDCEHDSLKDDHEFLPQGTYRWTQGRYWRKLDNVARTLASLTEEDRWPDLVGMCEVENDTVLRDLTRRSPLRAAGYEYVMTDSPDKRGVDVGLLYQPSHFRMVRYEALRVPSQEYGLRPTRDILHVVGCVGERDTLHVLVVHLPSRAGGLASSTRNRLLAASIVADAVDSLSQKQLLVMGDFNAEPGDDVFKRLMPPLRSLIPQGHRARGKGTYYFRQRWCFLDHILLSESLYERSQKEARVATMPFLLTKEGIPRRTYKGTAYSGGFSDHLPLTTKLFIE